MSSVHLDVLLGCSLVVLCADEQHLVPREFGEPVGQEYCVHALDELLRAVLS